MQVPRLTKVTLNMGVGEAKQDSKMLEAAEEQLATIAGQKPSVRRARKSIAAFKLREEMPVGLSVTLRGARMWEFVDRLVSIALPRVRDFRGLNPRSLRRPRQLEPWASASRSSSPRSTTTRSTRCAASTWRSPPPPPTTSRRSPCCDLLGFPFQAEGRPGEEDVRDEEAEEQRVADEARQKAEAEAEQAARAAQGGKPGGLCSARAGRRRRRRGGEAAEEND